MIICFTKLSPSPLCKSLMCLEATRTKYVEVFSIAVSFQNNNHELSLMSSFSFSFLFRQNSSVVILQKEPGTKLKYNRKMKDTKFCETGQIYTLYLVLCSNHWAEVQFKIYICVRLVSVYYGKCVGARSG